MGFRYRLCKVAASPRKCRSHLYSNAFSLLLQHTPQHALKWNHYPSLCLFSDNFQTAALWRIHLSQSPCTVLVSAQTLQCLSTSLTPTPQYRRWCAWTTRSSSTQQNDITAYHIKIPLFSQPEQCSICSREHRIVPSFVPLTQGWDLHTSAATTLPATCTWRNSPCILGLQTHVATLGEWEN